MVNRFCPMGIRFPLKEGSVLTVVDNTGPLKIMFWLQKKHGESGLVLGLLLALPKSQQECLPLWFEVSPNPSPKYVTSPI